MDTDFLLIQKMRLGEDRAVETFVEKYYGAILKYCCLHIGSREDAEDITQETFERFFRSFPEYHHFGKAVNYLYVIAGNICRDYYRKKKEVAVAFLPEKAENSLEGLEELLDVRGILDKLPGELKEPAILYFFQERKQKEISKILGISLSLVKYRIKRVRELLEKELKGWEDYEKK